MSRALNPITAFETVVFGVYGEAGSFMPFLTGFFECYAAIDPFNLVFRGLHSAAEVTLFFKVGLFAEHLFTL
jgi:hypothetical protein